MKVLFKGELTHLSGNELQVGDKAPDFSLVANDFTVKSLKSFEGKKKVIMTYPSIDTPVCATENRKFNEHVTAFGKDVVVLSVSMDLPFAQKRFCAAEGLTRVVPLSDYMHASFARSYGVLIDSVRLMARAVFVVDEKDIIRYIEWVPDVAMEPNYDAAFHALRAL